MSNGSLDYSHLKDREILLLLVQKVDSLEALPKRVASLERYRAWFVGVGSAITAALTVMEIRRR